MQKKIGIVYLLIALILSACAAPAGTTAPTPIVASPTGTSTITATSTPTTTQTPTLTFTSTPLPPTATLTRQPSRTPSAPETCPQVKKNIRPQFGSVFKSKKEIYHDARKAVLDFLNNGGNPQTAIAKLAENGVSASQFDLTADGIPEFLLPSGHYSIFGCHKGKYRTLLDLAPSGDIGYNPLTLVVDDLNQNGVPDILIAQVIGLKKFNYSNYQPRAIKYSLLEWDGTKLIPLTPENDRINTSYVYIKNHEIYSLSRSDNDMGAINKNWAVFDIDNDGLKEIFIKPWDDRTFSFNLSQASNRDLEKQMMLKSKGAGFEVIRYIGESTATPTPFK